MSCEPSPAGLLLSLSGNSRAPIVCRVGLWELKKSEHGVRLVCVVVLID